MTTRTQLDDIKLLENAIPRVEAANRVTIEYEGRLMTVKTLHELINDVRTYGVCLIKHDDEGKWKRVDPICLTEIPDVP